MSFDILNHTIGFTISAPWGHFRKPEGTISRMTYKVPPRTTVAGMMAAIVGKPRNSYYDEYSFDNLSVSIVPTSDIKTETMPENVIGTAPENMKNINSRGGGPKLSIPDPSDQRKQRVYELLHQPSYRVYLSFKSRQSYQEVKKKLESGKSVYTPTLGLSECIARIDEDTVETDISPQTVEEFYIDSIVPSIEDVIPNSDTQIVNERAPLDMSQTSGTTGRSLRRTDMFVNYVVHRDSDSQIQITNNNSLSVYNIEGNNICFL